MRMFIRVISLRFCLWSVGKGGQLFMQGVQVCLDFLCVESDCLEYLVVRRLVQSLASDCMISEYCTISSIVGFFLEPDLILECLDEA